MTMIALDSWCSKAGVATAAGTRLQFCPLVPSTSRAPSSGFAATSGFFLPLLANHRDPVQSLFESQVVRPLRPFHRTGKLGATPGTRREWTLQTRLKTFPESAARCKARLKMGTQETGDSKTTHTFRCSRKERSLWESKKQMLNCIDYPSTDSEFEVQAELL
jgi:hypothetical protein